MAHELSTVQKFMFTFIDCRFLLLFNNYVHAQINLMSNLNAWKTNLNKQISLLV